LTPSTETPLGPLKQIEAGMLSIGYAEAGGANAPVVILLHGWPYDIHSFAEVAPLLGAAGYRVIVPYLRGYGSTRFLSDATPRNGQQAALGADAIAFMDALGRRRGTASRPRSGRTRSRLWTLSASTKRS
jgi:pimeloyl-ACP methyl ester carboxylesterase